MHTYEKHLRVRIKTPLSRAARERGWGEGGVLLVAGFFSYG
jgi:hypothetical protein